jgi:hypothetical protein
MSGDRMELSDIIEGLNVRCNIGPVQILRTPYLELAYKRRAVLTRAVVEIPDPFGLIRAAVAVGQPMILRFGYRGGQNLWHEWEGLIDKIDQPGLDAENPDALTVRGVGLEKALSTTIVTESFYMEPAYTVALRLLARTGLPVGMVDIPGDLLPHQVFSGVTVARALKQLENSLQRSLGYDLSQHAVWLGAAGLMWSLGDEPGPAYIIETAQNLVDHTPPPREGDMGSVVSVLMPGLRDGMRVRIRDKRRGVYTLARAEEVIHVLQARGNSTTVLYGKQAGWG